MISLTCKQAANMARLDTHLRVVTVGVQSRVERGIYMRPIFDVVVLGKGRGCLVTRCLVNR